MATNSFKEPILGARTGKTLFAIIIFFLAGISFFLVGLSSYFQRNFFPLTDTSEIVFIPQGLTMIFYGTCSLGLFCYLSITFFLDIGSGYNEFFTEEKIIRIVRLGFPGKTRKIFLSYDFASIKKLKLFLKQGFNPRCNILLVLKDNREIPLYPAHLFLNPIETEKKAVFLAKLLNTSVEINVTE